MKALLAMGGVGAFCMEVGLIKPPVALPAEGLVQVRVEGVSGALLENVRASLTLPRGLVRDGVVDRLWFGRFVRQAETMVQSALQPFGYYHAVVTISLETMGQGVSILRVRVVPGIPIRIAEVRVQLTGPGAGDEALRAHMSALPFHRGEVLLQPLYTQAKAALLSTAVERGYLKAAYSTHEIRITAAIHRADLAWTLETGPRFHFQGVTFTGAPDYPHSFLRRYLPFTSGEPFSNAKLAEGRLNLTRAERFTDVAVVPTVPETGTEVPVEVKLAQLPSRVLRTGVGYGTDTGARFSTTYRDMNLFNRGHETTTNLYLSEKMQGAAMAYTLPSASNFRNFTSLRLEVQREKVAAYLSRMASVELSRTHGFATGNSGSVYLRVQQETYTTEDHDQRSRLLLPGARYATDRFDNLIRPRRGYHLAGNVMAILQPHPAPALMAQCMAEGSAFLPLAGSFVLQMRLRVGATAARRGVTADLPPSLRFFAGGSQTVRGYAYQSLGPLDAQGRVVGGRHLFSISVEPEWSFLESWGISVFGDAGNAFDAWSNLKLHRGAGLGLHYHSPVGSLNLSLARQVAAPNPKKVTLHFSVGYAF